MQYDRPYNDEINLGDLFTKLGEYRRYLLKKWWVILLAALAFSFLLRFYIIWKKETYVSHSDFAVKGVEGASTSSLASLASSFGIGITTGTEFTNEYFLGIIQSRSLIKQTLLQKRTIQLDKKSEPREDYLCNFYIEMYPKWAKKKKIKNFRITHGNFDSLSRGEDSALTVIYDEIIDADLTVEFNDEVGMNQLEFESLNYDFSATFADYIAIASSDFYINSQLKNEFITVNLIQHKADSIRAVMEQKENLLANTQDRSAFTIKASGLLSQGRLLRDIEILNLEYSTTYSQLELAKFDLKNKTPLVTLIDTPKHSTIKEKEQTTLFMILGLVLGTIICTIVLSVRKYVKDSVEESKQKKLLIEQHKAVQDVSLIEKDSNKI
ncbi:MAG: hypothetical protein H7Y00_14500 [Fimbriimonadaceae bacterium]|nr:hypothetical protein [Chitinophagales bacterium]